jgi:uncharacterized surface protein with fasciclin (FAS1) repeats
MKTLLRATAATFLAVGIAGSAFAGHHGDAAKSGKDTMSEPAAATADVAKADIVDTAVAAGSFTTLAAALEAAGLVEALKGDGPFTVFAPTDAAFAKLGDEKIQELLKPENKETLASILKYHVVAGKVMSSDIAGKKLKVETLEGSKAKVNAKDGVKIDNATVTGADILASNGVIHVIDTVILP